MPIITISRMYGSGGSEVAERVARSLKWELLDNAIVDAVAQRLGVTPAEVEAREERVPSLVERLTDALSHGTPEAMAPLDKAQLPPDEERLVQVSRVVVEEAVARGPIVVVGRGAQSILASRQDALHVLCVAPRAALVRRTMERLDIPRAQAERVVQDTNHQREQYVRRYYDRAWLAPESYHLCVNTEWLGLDGAAEVIVRLALERFGVGA